MNKKLFEGRNGGAGEFGMVGYLDKSIEYYASGQFFQNVYHVSGELVFENARKGDAGALKMYEEMGMHFGNANTVCAGCRIDYSWRIGKTCLFLFC